MKSITIRATLVITLALAASLVFVQSLPASDLASSANIFMFPKPQAVSDMVLNNHLGRSVSLQDYRGKVVLLHFWSVQCPACRIEEPLLEKLKQVFGPSGLEVLGVNLVDAPQAIFNHAASKKFSFPILFDHNGSYKLKPISMGGRNTAFVVNPQQEAILEVPGFPTTYILDCRGNAVGFSVGAARWDNRAAVALIQNLIADRKTCLSGTSQQSERLHSSLAGYGLYW
jgi:thiol-disulfide isomerase/thioredoxin